ncbi:MAG: CapA family protein [Candidatus Saccharibacteria bacterium]|nr:CapA family protein [Candidatus Saccharibacteria bacterium]
MRLSFVGDIMCSKEQLSAVRSNGTSEDFSAVFADVVPLFSQSDMVVANLETPVAGEGRGLVDHKWSFNAPISFARAVRRAGIDVVTTANNHCLDRGIDGATATMDALDEIGLAHTGMRRSKKDTPWVIREVSGKNIGVIAFTYGTNRQQNNITLPWFRHYLVNLFQYQEVTLRPYQLVRRVVYKVRREVFWLRSPLRLWRMLRTVRQCRRAGADYVVMCLHVGGQHNDKPEAFTKWICDVVARHGANAVMACHEHVVHPIVRSANVPIAYSMGNFLYHPRAEDVPHRAKSDLRSDYAVIVHLDVQADANGVPHTTVAVSVTKNIVSQQGVSIVAPAATLYEQATGAAKQALYDDIAYIVETATGRPFDGIVRAEYVIA